MHKKIPSYSEKTEVRIMLLEAAEINLGSMHHSHSNLPNLRLSQSASHTQGKDGHFIPGFRAPQSAHLSFPGTDLMSSCNAFSLRAWLRLLIVVVMIAPAQEGWTEEGRLEIKGGPKVVL